MRFSVFTNVNHFKSENKIFAYAPYVREMNLWFKNVDEVEIIAPIFPSQKNIPIEGESYYHSNLQFNEIPSLQFLDLRTVAFSAIKLPSIIFKIFRAMQLADHIHLRCPGNVGLLACFVQILFPKKPKTAKYAGNWDPGAKQPWSYTLQKKILNNSFLTRNMTVLVYGKWNNQSRNILSFFTASFKGTDKEEVVKQLKSPYQFLYVGNLVPGKQPMFCIRLVEALNKNNIDAELHVYGNGELRESLETATKNKSYVHFYGNQPLEKLKEAYKKGHFLILASKSEGWPKAIAEAMFFGCIPVASTVSCIPWMLDYGGRGILAPVGHEGGADDEHLLEEIVNDVEELIYNPREMKRMSLAAQKWSQQYTLGKFEVALKKILGSIKRTQGKRG